MFTSFCCTYFISQPIEFINNFTFFSGLINEGCYQSSVLRYYNGQSDYVNIAGAITKCIQRGGVLVMPKNNELNSAVYGVGKSVFRITPSRGLKDETKFQ